MKTKKLWLNSVLAIALLLAAGWSHCAQAAMKIHMPIDKLTGLPADESPPPQPPKPLLPDPNAKSPAFVHAQQQCGFPKSRTYLTEYRDLTGVVLDVYVPGRYIEAQKCVGREEACIDESRVGEGKRKEALNDLLMRGIAYRAPIHLDNLVKIFSDVLRQNLMPYVLPDQNCKAPNMVVVTNARDAKPYLFMPNVLTVRVDLTITDDAQPPIAVLTMGTHRLDPTQQQMWTTITGQSTGIPLDLTDEQITTRIKYFAQWSLAIDDEKRIVE